MRQKNWHLHTVYCMIDIMRIGEGINGTCIDRILVMSKPNCRDEFSCFIIAPTIYKATNCYIFMQPSRVKICMKCSPPMLPLSILVLSAGAYTRVKTFHILRAVN